MPKWLWKSENVVDSHHVLKFVYNKKTGVKHTVFQASVHATSYTQKVTVKTLSLLTVFSNYQSHFGFDLCAVCPVADQYCHNFLTQLVYQSQAIIIQFCKILWSTNAPLPLTVGSIRANVLHDRKAAFDINRPQHATLFTHVSPSSKSKSATVPYRLKTLYKIFTLVRCDFWVCITLAISRTVMCQSD